MCHLKDPRSITKNFCLNGLETSSSNLLEKKNYFNKFFIENKLNLFRTLEGIREIDISKKSNKVRNCIQNGNNMTVNS